MIKIEKILVPVDFSRCSRAALKHAIHFGKMLGATTIDVLHVWQPPAFLKLDTKLHSEDGKEQTLAEFANSEGGKTMKEFLAEVEEAGDFQVHGRLETGSLPQTVVQVASAEEYDMIVMGTHGETMGNTKLGSTAQKVVRNATCPVLVVPHELAEEDDE